MLIWLVNPFDPLPGDPAEQEGRYATLVRLLVQKGHKVTWWTSSFSHRFKKPVDQQVVTEVCKAIGIDMRFLLVPAYYNNVGAARLWNHYLLAKRFCKAARIERNPPDVILASAPPPMLTREAAKLAKEFSSKLLIDVQDPWPETFYRIAPGFLRPFLSVLFMPWRNASINAYKIADAIIGVADAYVKLALEYGGPKTIYDTIPLGVDLAAFYTAVTKGRRENLTKPSKEIWFVYAGSLSQSYDCLTIVYTFAKIHNKLTIPIRLFITGRGELREKIEQIIHKQHLTNITLTGFLDFEQWAYLLSQCDVGFNASFPKAMIYLPNKIFYYFAAGLAVANTIAGP